ncbi:MAG: hypothetical protein L0H55_08340, partial [Candidatus Nitrosocosmicus sp.]|nr:hypothetical protein [Candidatus Nitrosocosmicus sp.]
SLNKLLRSYVIKCISLSNEHIRIMNEIDNENHTLIKRLCKGLEADLQRENNGLFFTIAMEIKLDSSRSFKIPSDVEIVIGEGKEEPLPLPVYPNTFVDIEPKSIRLFKVNGNEIEDERKIKFSQLMKGATIGLDTFYNDGGTERLDGIINSVNFRSRHDVKETTISLSFNKGREEGIKIREYFDRVEVKRYLINDPSFLRLRQDSKVHEKIKTMKKDFEIALDKMFP